MNLNVNYQDSLFEIGEFTVSAIKRHPRS